MAFTTTSAFRWSTLLLVAVLLISPGPAHSQGQGQGQGQGVSQSQSSSGSTTTSAPSSTQSVSLSLTTSPVISTTTTRNGDQNVIITTTFNSVYNVTITPTATTPSSTSSASPTPTPVVLATKLDPAFAVLGALLILTGLPSAFWGHKNRWTSFFLIGFYTLSLVCIVLILKFGVLNAVNPPSKSLRGLFVLSSAIAGIAGGGIAIFFWKGAKYFIGAWGGFAVALFVQCFRNGGLIGSTSMRWILYIVFGTIGFVLSTIPKIHYHTLLVSTAFVGATSFILGVDCYTTAGLKEFYIWNLGFKDLFPKYTEKGIKFPVSQSMQIELGLMSAVALVGVAVQLRVLRVLQLKLKEIAEEQRKRDEEAEIDAAERFAAVIKERDDWERDHPLISKFTTRRNGSSGFSLPLLRKDKDGFGSPSLDSTANKGERPRSAVSEFFAAPVPDDELNSAEKSTPNSALLPNLDLGTAIKDDVPRDYILGDVGKDEEKAERKMTHDELEDVRRRNELMSEILTMRRSIEFLKSETSTASWERPRASSMTSRPALSPFDVVAASSSHSRPPREHDPRRAGSTGFSGNNSPPPSHSRQTSTVDWDNYVQDRKLMQPPAGVTDPIIPTPSGSKMNVPPAVAEALNERKRREGALSRNDDSASDDVPLAKIQRQKAFETFEHNSTNKNDRPNKVNRDSNFSSIPVILPPRRSSPNSPTTPPSARVRTFEELNERHREKLRGMQAPLTQSERDSANLEAAKFRWERSKALEKEAVTKRQAEKAAQVQKDQGKRKGRKNGEEARDERAGRRASADPHRVRHSRSLSADKLRIPGGGLGDGDKRHSSSKRVSTMKVEDWQKFQRHSGTHDPAPERLNRSSHRPQRGGEEVAPERRRSAVMPSSRVPPS